MGARGPVPKRSKARRRQDAASKPEIVAVPGTVTAPNVSGHWHPIAKSWFRSLKESGQAQFFEPSDWQAARYVAEVMTRSLRYKTKVSAPLFSGVWRAMADLLTTEASRRRVRMEIERDEVDEPAEDEGVADLDAYRDRVSR